MRIQHNIPALNAYRNYTNNTSNVAKNLEKLSSGYRINRAGDDAAGLAISEKMRAQITGLQTAQKNAKDGISLIQTGEGALTEVHSMLNRMTELANQSANGTYDNDVDRANLQKEVASLTAEIDRIADSTNYNGINLLDGSKSATGGVGAAGVPSVKGLEDFIDTAPAVKAAANTANFADITTGAADGGNLSMTINYKDANGKDQSTTVSFTIDDTNKKLVAADGTTYGYTSLTNLKKGEQQDAFLAEFKKTDLGKTFTMTKSTDAIKFEAKTAGQNTKISSIIADLDGDTTLTDGTLQTLASVTAGADAYQFADMTKLAAGQEFTIGGKKFAFFDTQADAVAAGSSVNGIVLAAAGTVANADVIDMVDLIEQKTGYKAEIDAGTNTQINFVAPAGSTAIKGGGLTLQIGDSSASFNQLNVSIGDMHAKALGIQGLDISTQEGASAATDLIKAAINSVSGTRGDMGALQNRLEHTINNLSVAEENITNAEASIRDVDVAKEMMAYTKNNILVQSAQAMLAQANQLPQGVLQLLQ